MKPCDHLYGITDIEDQEGGATWHYNNPPFYKDHRYEAFKFCPHCGEKLIEDNK